MISVYDISKGKSFFSQIDSYTYDGYGDYLLKPLSATLKAEYNGTYTLNCKIDISDYYRDNKPILYIGSIVNAKGYSQEYYNANMWQETNKTQLYSIYDIKINNYEVEFNAEPILYRLFRQKYCFDVRPVMHDQLSAIAYIIENSYGETLMNILRDGVSTTVASAYYINKTMLQAICGTDENNFKDRWSTVVVPDNAVSHIIDKAEDIQSREIKWRFSYGKDLTGIKINYDGSAVARWIRPTGFNGIAMSTNYSTNGGVKAPNISLTQWNTANGFQPKKEYNFPYVKMAADIQEGEDTTGLIICNNQNDVNTALYNETMKLYNNKNAGIWNTTVDIDVVDLSQNIAVNEQDKQTYKNNVGLGDLVNIHSELHNFDANVRVVAVTYDYIQQCNTKLTLSNSDYEFNKLINRSLNTGGLVYKSRYSN